MSRVKKGDIVVDNFLKVSKQKKIAWMDVE